MKGRGACHLRAFRVGRRQALFRGLLNSWKTDSVIAGQSCPASIAYRALRSGWRGIRLGGADIFGTTRILQPIRNRACSLPSPPWPRQTAASGFPRTIETYVALRASVGLIDRRIEPTGSTPDGCGQCRSATQTATFSIIFCGGGVSSLNVSTALARAFGD
jgi:hypothetical protein